MSDDFRGAEIHNKYRVDQGHREFPFGIPGNSRESATSKIPGGNSPEFLNFWRKILTVHKISKLFLAVNCESSPT